jgi:hypothetical protein
MLGIRPVKAVDPAAIPSIPCEEVLIYSQSLSVVRRHYMPVVAPFAVDTVHDIHILSYRALRHRTLDAIDSAPVKTADLQVPLQVE